jgi:hypothetical protein
MPAVQEAQERQVQGQETGWDRVCGWDLSTGNLPAVSTMPITAAPAVAVPRRTRDLRRGLLLAGQELRGWQLSMHHTVRGGLLP